MQGRSETLCVVSARVSCLSVHLCACVHVHVWDPCCLLSLACSLAVRPCFPRCLPCSRPPLDSLSLPLSLSPRFARRHACVSAPVSPDSRLSSEDGRLEKELNYMKSTLGEGIGNTNQLLIQTPRDTNANILHADALLYHLQVMQAATEITVDLFEV